MDDAAGGFAGHERQAVVARVDAEEPEPDRRAVGGLADQLRWQPHGVPQLEAEDVAVEVQRLHVVAGGEHDVAEALLLGDERVAVRADDAPVLERRAVEDLERVARRVVEGDHLVHPAIGQLGRGGLLVRRALDVERVADLLQPSSIRRLPAGLQQPVVLAGNDHQARRELVHPQVERAVGGPAAFDHAEHLERVLAPRRDVGGLEAEIPQ